MKRILAIALWSGLAACSGDTGSPQQPTGSTPKFVAFRQRAIVIDRLETRAEPPYAVGSSHAGELLTSSDPSVVEVDSAGNLIAHRNGRASIRSNGGAALDVLVQAVTTFKIIPAHLDLEPGATQEVEVSADGGRLSTEGFHWQTSNPDVAVAFGSKVQAGRTQGTATLTAVNGTTTRDLVVVVRTRASKAK